MLLAAVMTLTGACLGIVLASVSVPRIRLLPLLSSIVLILVAATSLLVFDATNLVAALIFVAATAIASVVYAGVLWKRNLPELPYSLGWFCRTHLIRPNYLRGLYAEQRKTSVTREFVAP